MYLEILTSWETLGHSKPVTGLLYLYLMYISVGAWSGVVVKALRY